MLMRKSSISSKQPEKPKYPDAMVDQIGCHVLVTSRERSGTHRCFSNTIAWSSVLKCSYVLNFLEKKNKWYFVRCSWKESSSLLILCCMFYIVQISFWKLRIKKAMSRAEQYGCRYGLYDWETTELVKKPEKLVLYMHDSHLCFLLKQHECKMVWLRTIN